VEIYVKDNPKLEGVPFDILKYVLLSRAVRSLSQLIDNANNSLNQYMEIDSERTK
jgi:hypothetical protein